MKEKHLKIRINQCLEIAKASNCIRRKVGAILLDPERNVILMDGYNGPPRGGPEICGGDCCIREKMNLESGRDMQIGCHHAEINVIANSCANGIKTSGAWLMVNCQPCEMCAKLIHHSNIKRVIIIANTYPSDKGVNYLIENGIEVESLNLELE